LLQEIGLILALGGALFTVAGTLINNVKHKHYLAMKFWMVSNPLWFLWAVGYLAGLWTAELGVIFFAGMYAVFMITNWYGLTHDPLAAWVDAHIDEQEMER